MQKFWNSASHGFFFFLFLLFFPFLPPFFFLLGLSEVFSLSVLFFLGLTTCSTKKNKEKQDSLTTVSLHLEYHFRDIRERSPSSGSSLGQWPYLSHYLTQFMHNNWANRISVLCNTLKSELLCYFISLEIYFEFTCISILIDQRSYLPKKIHKIF